jgi:hypothetical protein
MRHFFVFLNANRSVVAQSRHLWDSECCTWADFTSICASERSTDEMFASEKGRKAVVMPRLRNNLDRDFSASQSEGHINADIAEFFASRSLGIVEPFAGPIVRMRIGSLI